MNKNLNLKYSPQSSIEQSEFFEIPKRKKLWIWLQQ